MAGIILDSAQHVQWDALHAKYLPLLQASSASLNSAGQQVTSSALAAAGTLYTNYIEAARAILTPAQQTVFDANRAAIKARVAAAAATLAQWRSAQ
jgi:hypothetical protein